MVTREEFLAHLWEDVIDSAASDQALDNTIANCKRDPHGPFGDIGAAIERLLDAGATRRDLRLIFRGIAYEAVFGTLYALGDPGLEEGETAAQLYEDLLTSDPSGMEGRPGSIDKVSVTTHVGLDHSGRRGELGQNRAERLAGYSAATASV